MENEELEEAKEEGVAPIWCVVANVVMERPYGPGGKEVRRGTKHFRPGAKVVCTRFTYGTVWVVGRHRASNRFILLAMPSVHLTNWRIELVYSPAITRMIREYWEENFWGLPLNDSDEAKAYAEKMLTTWISGEQRGKTQSYISTRGPREDSTG